MKTKQEHLIAIKAILQKFMKKHNFLMCYFTTDTSCTARNYGRFDFSCGSELDDFTFYEMKRLKSKLNDEIVKYLEDNKIEDTVYFKSECRGWATSHVRIYFEESIILNSF
jgi:hypothetical protein